MTAVTVASPAPVYVSPAPLGIHSNSTITASGSQLVTNYGGAELNLIINVTAGPTGSTPTLQYSMVEVDPGNGTTVLGTTVSSTVVNTISIQKVTLPVVGGGAVLISWTVTGAGASFTGVYATLSTAGNSIQILDSLGTGINSLTTTAGQTALDVALTGTNYVTSSANSSTAQLASNATFTGTIESIFNAQTISIIVNSDQPGTMTLTQYITSSSATAVSSWPYQLQAGVGFSRSFVANGNYFNLTFKNTGGSTTTTLNINTAYGILPASTNLGNQPVSLNEVNGIQITTKSGNLPVTLGDPGTEDIFGHLITSDRVAQITVPFFSGTPSQLMTVTTTLSGSTTSSLGIGTFTSGVSSGAQAKGVTANSVSYTAMSELFGGFTAYFTTGVGGSSYQRVGMYNATDGFAFGYNQTLFGLWLRYNGSDNFVTKSTWNTDTCSSASTSKFTSGGLPVNLDPTKINLYRIRYGWLGIANIIFEILSPDGNFVIVHTASFANTQTTVSMTNPNVPLTVDVSNGTSLSNLVVGIGCMIAGSTAFAGASSQTWSSTSTQVTVTSGSTSLLAANALRKSVSVFNNGSVPVYLAESATASTSAFTTQIPPGWLYEFPTPCPTGAISAITASSTASVQITERY